MKKSFTEIRVLVFVTIVFTVQALLTLFLPRVSAWTATDAPVYRETYGGFATDEIHRPGEIARDNQGNYYVAFAVLGKVAKYDENWELIRYIGAAGTGDGQLGGYIVGLAVDSNNNLFVADALNNRIVRFDSNGNFINNIGTFGTGDGQFNRPADIGIDNNGNIFVSELSGNRIQKFDANWNFLVKWGTTGTADGQFRTPVGLTLDTSGNVYVIDQINNRIQKFTNNGVFITKFGAQGSGNGQFLYPVDLAVASNGMIYVCDSSNNRIQVFNADTTYVSTFGNVGTTQERVSSPYGMIILADSFLIADINNNRIAQYSDSGTWIGEFLSTSAEQVRFLGAYGLSIDSQDNLYVASYTANQITVISKQGEYLRTIGTSAMNQSGSADGQFSSPNDVHVDKDGNIWVADTYNYRIQKFDSTGNFLLKFGTNGTADGQFNRPTGISSDSEGNIYVVDGSNNRIQKFDSNGNFILKWGTAGTGDGQFNFQLSSQVNVDQDDNVWVGDWSNKRVQKFTKNGVFLLKFGTSGTGNGQFAASGGPHDLAFDDYGNIYATDLYNSRVQVFDSAGNFVKKFGIRGDGPMQFTYPSAIIFDSVGDLYVADEFNSSIQRFTFDREAPTINIANLAYDLTNNSDVTISGTAVDSLSAVTSVVYQVDSIAGTWSNCTAQDLNYNALNEGFICELQDLSLGEHTIYVKATDSFTNISTESAYTFVIETTPPTGTVMINSGAVETNNNSVTIQVSASDNTGVVSEMIFSENSDFNGANWESYATTKSFVMTNTEGIHRIYAKFRDGAGNESLATYDEIFLDLTKPTVIITNIGLMKNIPNKTPLFYYFDSQSPKIKGITEAGSKVTFRYETNIFETTADASGNYLITITNLPRELVILAYTATDKAGNLSDTRIVKLLIGVENFPQASAAITPELGVIVTPTIEEKPTEEQQFQVFELYDEAGKILTNVEVSIDGQKYKSSKDGKINVEGEVTPEMNIKVLIGGVEVDGTVLGQRIVAKIAVAEIPQEKESDYWWWLLFIVVAGIIAYVFAKQRKIQRK